MSRENYDQFHQLVLREPALQLKLREERDLIRFVNLVVQTGKEHGFDFTSDDVQAALNASRRAWLEKWI